MFAYRERRLRAFDHAGAAEVKFLTAGNVEFKADLRDERAGRVEPCSCGAYGANEGLGMPVLSNTGIKQCGQRCANCDPRPKVPGTPRNGLRAMVTVIGIATRTGVHRGERRESSPTQANHFGENAAVIFGL